jgi:hypothetical protein
MSDLFRYLEPAAGGVRLNVSTWGQDSKVTFIRYSKNRNYVFLLCELRGLSPNFHSHVSVSDLYIPRIGPHISCSRIGRPILEIYESLTDI